MGESESIKQETISPLEYLDKLCAYAMSIGMSYHDYWYGDYEMLKYFVEAEKIRQRKQNQLLWLQGLYVHIAIGDLVPILNPFSKEHKAKPYLKEPIPLSREEVEESERRKVERLKTRLMSRVKRKSEVGKK